MHLCVHCGVEFESYLFICPHCGLDIRLSDDDFGNILRMTDRIDERFQEQERRGESSPFSSTWGIFDEPNPITRAVDDDVFASRPARSFSSSSSSHTGGGSDKTVISMALVLVLALIILLGAGVISTAHFSVNNSASGSDSSSTTLNSASNRPTEQEIEQIIMDYQWPDDYVTSTSQFTWFATLSPDTWMNPQPDQYHFYVCATAQTSTGSIPNYVTFTVEVLYDNVHGFWDGKVLTDKGCWSVVPQS